MPIDYMKYPANWLSEIRPRILKRANNKCEECGIENYSIVVSYKENGKTVWKTVSYEEQMMMADPFKVVRVVVTIAHLDHDELNVNVSDDRLKAMCQLCHLRYDAKEKSKRKQHQIMP